MSRSRAQGTRLESELVARVRARGLPARRLAEGGLRDEGDVEVFDEDGFRHVIEAKACERLSLHAVWLKARRKAPATARVAVVWKRVTLKAGNARRTADGPVLVAVPLDDYLDLLSRSAT